MDLINGNENFSLDRCPQCIRGPIDWSESIVVESGRSGKKEKPLKRVLRTIALPECYGHRCSFLRLTCNGQFPAM